MLALYARGMTVREIQGFLAEMYAVEVSPDLISTVTDGIVAEVTAWQSRPLEPPVSGRVLRRAAGQDSRRSDGPQQGRLSRAGRAAGRHPRHPGAVDRADRGRQILDEGLHAI